MIEWYQVLILAIVQGLTEFLPISSSAHLVIPSLVLHWPDQGLAFDVAVHVGTLLAVVAYYRKDLLCISQDWLRSLFTGHSSDDSALAWYLLLATIPAVLVGVLGRDFIEANLRTVPVIATTTLIFGLLLGLADRNASRGSPGTGLSAIVALIIGCAQAIALVPGVSRSGATITAGLFLGMSRLAAARFSFLLSVPVIAGAGSLKCWDLYSGGSIIDWEQLAVAATVSGITAYACIAAFIRLLDVIGMMPFVVYRIVLALALYLLWLV